MVTVILVVGAGVVVVLKVVVGGLGVVVCTVDTVTERGKVQLSIKIVYFCD